MKRMWAAVAAAGLVALSGCSDGAGEPEGTPSPTTTPTLAEPVELDYYASVITDNGADLALVGDWMSQKLRVVDAEGDEKWSIDSNTNEDDGGGTEAYSAGENIIVHDYSGTTTAYSWADGQEVWSFDLPGTAGSCRPAQSFGTQSTSGGSHLGEGDLILLENIWMDSEENCEASAEGDTVLYALDPETGKEAWPALSVGEDGRTFGGRLLELAPDRKTGIMSWMDGDESMITRISFDDGTHGSIPITEAREINDAGGDYFTVYPTADPSSLTYVYGSTEPDDPMSSAVTRAAKLSVPADLKASDSATLAAAEHSADASMEDTFDAVCSTELRFTAEGKPACLQTQLFASAVKYQGSDGAVDGWHADAPEAAVAVIGGLGGPQWEPVDHGDQTLVVVPAPRDGIAALDAATGKTVWTTDGPRLKEEGETGRWGGQGILPDLGLIVVTDNKKTTFFDAKTGKPVSDHPAGDYSDQSSSGRFVIATNEDTSTMWAVVDT
ncbi:outer membrane protein assembly factor BamB family protein [Brevibacterium limosum]|uniref:outer membrane protein assembly factor BamB family protein n=1 Tax=Brevibacterium limosum TaxID=2697565 RepID=UPI0014237495|nr:PQQ-binding-like beta-propeller repeat protein [Brevibacterium limosum]